MKVVTFMWYGFLLLIGSIAVLILVLLGGMGQNGYFRRRLWRYKA